MDKTIIQDYGKYLSKVNPEKGRRRAQEQEAKWAEERRKREEEKLTEAYQRELRERAEQAARERRKVEKATAAFNAEQERKGTRSNQMNRRELRQIREGVSNIANPTLPFKSPDEFMARAIQANELRKETLPFKPVSQNRVSETGSLAGFPRVERTSNINQGLFQPTGDIIANNRAIDNLTVRQPEYREEKKLPEVKPSDRYNNQNIRTEQKKSKRDTRFDSDFDRFYEYRYEKADFTDYDPKTDTTVEHWRNLKEEIKKKNKWSDKEFEDRWKAYDKERAQQAADSEVQTALDIAEKHPVLGTLLQAAYTPQGMIEGAASALSNLLPDEFKAQSADDPLFTGTRSKEGIRQTVKDEHINSDLGKGAYDLATGLGDMLLAQGIPVLGTAALGGNAAANTNMQALERGVDPKSAAKTGAVAGIASGLLNRVGLDAALGSEASTALRTIGKAALKEGAENVLEDVTNLTADKLINKDMSQLNTLHDYYVGQGVSDDDAWKRAALDTAKNLGLSAATGAAFGGLMSAAGNIPRLKADFTASRTQEQPIEIPELGDSAPNPSANEANTTALDVVRNIDGTKNQIIGNSSKSGVNAGRATHIDNVYTGTKPVQSVKSNSRYTVPEGSYHEAEVNILKSGAGGQNGGKKMKNIKKLYSYLFPNGEYKDVRVKNVTFNDKPYSVRINKNVILETLNKNPNDPQIVSLLNHLEDIVRESDFADSGKYSSHGKTKDVERYDYFERPVNINGRDYICTMDIQVEPGSNNLHKYGVLDEINLVPEDYANIGHKPTATPSKQGNISNTNIPNPADNVNPSMSAGDSAPEAPNTPNMKVSDAYENTLKNSGIMTDDEIVKHTVPEDFSFESHNEIETMAEGARMREAEGEDFVPNRLEKEGFTAADVDGMMQAWRDKVAEARAVEEAGEDSDALWEEANTIFRKIQQESSRGGAALQAMAKWSRNTPEGMLSEAEHIVNKRIKVEGAKDGKSKKVKDAINKRMDKAAVEKQKPILTQAVEAYRSFADRITQSADASEYEGSVNNIRKLNDAINKFEKALDDGNIGRIQETYTALKRRAASMSKKGLSIDVANKDVEDAIKNLVKHSRAGGFEFSADFQKTFINEASKIQDLDPDSREFKEAYARLGRMVNDEIRRNTSAPKLLGQRITAYLMNNMLGNFRTLITRNAGGNLGLALTEQFVERPLAAGIDRLVAKKTGMRTQAGLSKAALKDYVTGFVKGISEEVQDVKSGLHTSRSGEVDLNDAIARNSDVFKTDSKNKLLKGLSGLARFKNSAVAHGLSVGDRPFYEAIYKQTLGDMNRLKEKGLLGDAIQNLTDAEYKALSEGVAQYNALFAVYQNDSKMSDALMGFKKSIGELSEGALGFDILSQFSMPFVKTPANVVDRAIDYSPLGLIRNAARTGIETLGKNAPGLNQNRFVNETARNIIGTGLMAGAGAAAYNGAMSGKYSKDKDEKAAQKEAGEQEYAANLPDNYQMDIGWIPVLGSNSVAAAAAIDAMKDSELSGLDKVLAGAKAGGKAMFDQSMFQGMQRLFGQGDTYNSEEGIVGNMINTVKQGATQAVPSLARQVAQVIDPYERDLSNGNYDINSIKNTLPIVRETLQPKVDSEGNYILQNQGRGIGSKIVENMILPGKITKIQPREMNTEAQRLQSETGNNYAYIPKVQRSEITTDDHTPTDKEYTDYQVDRNKSMSDAGKIMMNTNYYKSASPEEQEKLLKEVYENVKAGKKAEYTGKESTDNLVKLYNDNGHKKDDPKLLVRRMVQGEQIEQAGFNKTDKLYEYMDKGGNINDYKKFIDSVTHTTEAGNKSIYKDDYMEAISKLPEKQRKLISDAKSIDLSDEEQAAYDKGGIDAALKVWQKNKREKEKKAREKEKKLKQAAREAGVSPRVLDRLQGELAENGAKDSPTTVYYYNLARKEFPRLTTKAYTNKLRQYGGEDMKITKKELTAAANKEHWSQAEMEQNFRAFGEWKKIPKLVNGTWK